MHAFFYCKPIIFFCFAFMLIFDLVLKRCVFPDYSLKLSGLTEENSKHLKNKIAVGLSWLSLFVQNSVGTVTSSESAQQVK